MRELPWGYLFVAAVVLSILVGSSLGASVPRWINRSLNILWGIGGLAFLVGIPLAFMNETRTTTAGGGYQITLQTPQFTMIIFGSAVLAALVMAAIGVAHIAVGSRAAARERIAIGRDRVRSTVEHANRRGVSLGVLLLVAGGALSYFGGGITVTADGIKGGLSALIAGVAGLGFLIGGAIQVTNSLWPKPKIPH
jgi:hypothetical protein